jgi:hypothetical protein
MKPRFFSWHTPNPILIEALGHFPNSNLVQLIGNYLKNESKKGRYLLVGKELFIALIMMDIEESVNAIRKLFGNPKKRKHLVYQFVEALAKDPKGDYAEIVIHIISKIGGLYKEESIIETMAENGDISLFDLIQHKSKKVREVAIRVLNQCSESLITEEVIEAVNSIMNNKRDGIFLRSRAADILKRVGHEVPSRFKDRPIKNISGDMHRFVEGVLNIEKHLDDWAMTEIVETTYNDDRIRLSVKCSFFRLLTADVRIWRGCFWDRFALGSSFVKTGDKYIIRGICRGKNYETKPYDYEYILDNFGWILIGLTDLFVKDAGSEYARAVKFMNRVVARGNPEEIEYYRLLNRMWEVDWEKLKEEGGCHPK